MDGYSSGEERKPGEICVQDGLYEVIHRFHRPTHKVVVSQGDEFPRCNQCDGEVRFRLFMQNNREEPKPRARAYLRSAR